MHINIFCIILYHLLLPSIDGTDGRTDGRTPGRYIDYASSVNNRPNNYGLLKTTAVRKSRIHDRRNYRDFRRVP